MSHNHNHNEHFHKDEQGMLVKCYHKCKTAALDPVFWIGFTVLTPLEHALWTKVPGLSYIWALLGLA